MSISKARLDMLAKNLTELIFEDEDDRSGDENSKKDLATAIADCVEDWLDDNPPTEIEDEDEEPEEEPTSSPVVDSRNSEGSGS